jgi:VWFA-related protein
MILMLCSWASVRAQKVEEVIKVDVALVTVNVLVTDDRGRPLPGLQAADFQVTEEGKPMRVEFFDVHGPASIVFVIDLSSSMQGDKWRKLKLGMKKFLADAHSANDYTFIGFSDEPRIIARSINEAELWQVIDTVTPYGNTALYDAVLLGFNVLEQINQRHKALVLFSDGEDNSSRADLAEVKQQALTHNATIYTVGILNEQYIVPLPDGRTGKELLKDMASATGGLAHFPSSSEIKRVLEEIKADLTSRYSLSYYPSEKSPGWRRVKVSVTPGPYRPKLLYQQRYLVR